MTRGRREVIMIRGRREVVMTRRRREVEEKGGGHDQVDMTRGRRV